jgi:SynChlorMet cassette protein ScmC
MPPGLKLDLADGRRWLIRPADDNAAAVVIELGKAMRLGPGEAGRELYVAVSSESVLSDKPDPAPDAVVCRLAATADRDIQILQAGQIASLIARETLVRGGLLLHAALAEYRGSGFIMAGPGTVGKSTASARLPSPWHSLCDDMTLVVRDATGGYHAHPWPTWSRFFTGGTGGSWPVEHAVPLRTIFFLSQSPSDKLEPVNTVQAAALLLESAADLARETYRQTDEEAARALCSDGIRAARVLASAVPAYALRLSLDGRFWEDIERVLPVSAAPVPDEEVRDRYPALVVPQAADGSLHLVYTGTSMNPTLVEPEFLEVLPYGGGKVRPGDIVCFKSAERDLTVVHRVVAVGADGIRTRGDNNMPDDPWVLRPGDLIGRVKAAQRGTRRRSVPGGWRGLVALRWSRLGRRIWRRAGGIPDRLYFIVADLGPFDRLLPASLRPRLVRFHARQRVFLKLLMGGRPVGHYDTRRRKWHIRRPFRLFVKEQILRRVPVVDDQP